MAREYKDSGIEWIGDLPKGWRVCRLKELGYLYGGLTGKSGTDFDVEEDDKFAYFIPFTNIFNNMVVDTNKLYKVKVEDGEIQNEVHQGDLLFLMSSEDYEGIGKPALLDTSISHLYLNSFCKGLRIVSDNIVPKFLLYMMTSHIMREQIRLEAKGFIRINLRQEKLMNVFLYLPPISEQKFIISYLNKKCAEIDSLIELQEQMIAQLTDYKQSVITEVVTKGLNPEAELVPSGIDWIGNVPKGWRVCRIKDIFRLRTGTTPKGFEQGLDSQELVNWFTPSDVAEMNCELSSSERHLSKEVIEKEGIELSPAGSLLFVGIGSVGKIGYATVEGYSNQQITTLIPKPNKCFSKYSYYYMIADRKRIRDNAFYTILPIINNSYLSGVKSLLPPLDEQQSIASYLDTKCHEIDSLISLKQQKIEMLKDYKKSIIFEAVTGKTD